MPVNTRITMLTPCVLSFNSQLTYSKESGYEKTESIIQYLSALFWNDGVDCDHVTPYLSSLRNKKNNQSERGVKNE